MQGLFVAGTDTGVGKTVVASALLGRWRQAAHVRYWKPVQTGIEADDDTATALALAGLPAERALHAGVRLPRPLSPHLSASLAGTAVSVPSLLELAAQHATSERWIVEGAGGVLVPLDERNLMIDLIAMLGMPVVIAARTGLGTINHTLLTIEALRGRAIAIAGVVLVGPPNDDNRVAIETYGRVTVAGTLPWLEPLTPAALAGAAAALVPTAAMESALG